MLIHGLIALSLSLFIYWIAPKINIDPKPIIFQENEMILPKDVKTISWNNAERKLLNKIKGPESFTHNPETGEIYTGTMDGMIWKINKDLSGAEPVIRIGEDHKDCGLEYVEHICGRVLGLKFLSPDKLIVADAYNGIIIIDLNKLVKQVLVRSDQDINTKSLKMFNSVEISKDGIVYFTVFSMKWQLRDFMYSLIENESSGKIFSYNLISKKLVTIATNVAGANGLALSNNDTHLIVSESSKYRLLKFNLLNLNEGPKVLIDNLPGHPDNIKKAVNDNFHVAMVTLKSDLMNSYIYSYSSYRYLISWLTPKWLLVKFYTPISQIYTFDEHGKIISIINGTHLANHFITEAYGYGDKVLFGNLVHPHFDVINSK